MVSAVAGLMAAMMALMAAPAMAQVNFDFNDDDDNDFDNRDFRGFNNFGGFNLDNENDLESGPVDQEFSVTNTGDYASQCVPAVQFGNSGNFNNAPSFAQFGPGGGFVDGDDDDNDFRNGFFDFFDDRDNDRNDRVFGGGNTSIDDFEPGGIEFSVSPEVAVDCSNTIGQSSAASSTPYNYWG